MPLGRVLRGNVDHARLAARVDMGEFGVGHRGARFAVGLGLRALFAGCARLFAPRDGFLGARHGLLRRRAARRAREQGARRGGNVALPHQAFADQEGGNADARETGEVGGRNEPAFADDDAVARDLRRQALADVERGLESAQIAVVDADEPRFQPQRALKLSFLMNFDNTSMPLAKAASSIALAAASSTAAMMIRMQSAPSARDSTTW